MHHLLAVNDKIANYPEDHRQLNCSESLFTAFSSSSNNKFGNAWQQHNYFVYALEGTKKYPAVSNCYLPAKGECLFVRKGTVMPLQGFSKRASFIIFFMPDEFICEVMRSKAKPVEKICKEFAPVIALENNELMQAFFTSMIPYFKSGHEPDKALLELKFKELILTLADNNNNWELQSYFLALLQRPAEISLQQTMEDNFCHNLRLEDFARLTLRSLSSFKRDFSDIYKTSPGKWLMEKRLTKALHLLTSLGKTVTETAFETGFESVSHFSRAFRQRFGNSPASVKQRASVINFPVKQYGHNQLLTAG